MFKMENEQEKTFISTNVDDLLKLVQDQNQYLKKFPSINFEFSFESYFFYLKNWIYIVFKEKIIVKIIKPNNNFPINTEIRTNYELINFLSQNKININHVIVLGKKKKKLSECIYCISFYIKNKALILKIINEEIPKFQFSQICLNINNKYTKNEYSPFFNEYFPDSNGENNDIFIYIENEERKEILQNIFFLKNLDSIKKYKITGPFSTGKSITLFIISKCHKNIIYINLKTVKNYKNDYYKFLEILSKECSRIWINDNKLKDKFDESIKLINLEQNNLKILLEVVNILLNLLDKDTLILVLDQFKQSNVDYEPSFSKTIEEYIESKNLKVVYCSSINDNEIRDKLLPTFIDFKGNPEELNKDTQEFYFYYSELYSANISNSLSYILFKNKSRYARLLNEEKLFDSLKKIDNKIFEKLSVFKQYKYEKDIINQNFSLHDALIFLKQIIYKDLPITFLIEVISVSPLKFFVIKFDKDQFKIEPIFPYIEYFLSQFIQIKDCQEYFNKEKYNNLSFLSNRVKGEYFEYAAKLGIKERLKLEYNIDREVFVDQIAEMNEITTPFDFFLSSLKNKEIREEENDFNIEVNINKEKKENVGNKIKENNIEDINILEINLDDNIDENEIEKRIRESYMKEYNIFNLFENKDNTNKNIEEKKTDLSDINYIEKILLKQIDDYRIEEFNKRILNRKTEILDYINFRRIKNKNKRIINIPIITEDKKSKKDKKEKKDIKEKFTGNENIIIDQTNSNGKLVDYAFLYGEKNNKKFITFQMKCYSSNSNLKDIFINKFDIKERLSPMLINSMKLFNCVITEWHYELIFYFNAGDVIINNIGLKSIISCLNKDIRYILFNPKENKFYTRESDYNPLSKEKKWALTNEESNLDCSLFMNNILYHIDFENEFNKNISVKDFQIEFWEGFSKFNKDLEKYSKDILNYLKKELKAKKLFYCRHFKLKNIQTPRKNRIFLYKKKDSQDFIAVKNSEGIISAYDLGEKKEITKYLNLIDFDYEYSYILYFESSINKKKKLSFFLNTEDDNEFLIPSLNQKMLIPLNKIDKK